MAKKVVMLGREVLIKFVLVASTSDDDVTIDRFAKVIVSRRLRPFSSQIRSSSSALSKLL
jgi:hypothetical protein